MRIKPHTEGIIKSSRGDATEMYLFSSPGIKLKTSIVPTKTPPKSQMKDFVLDAPTSNRYTYFVAHYGKNFQCQTGLLHVEHNLDDSIQTLHVSIRKQISDVLGEETPSCYHILALASPTPIPCPVTNPLS